MVLSWETKHNCDYLQSIANSEHELNEAKLLFVGVGAVGKSELAAVISTPDYQFIAGRGAIRGIAIKKWKPLNCRREGKAVDFTANIWDFAGQEITYGTHQFFLTKNSIYAFVWDPPGRNPGKVSLLAAHSYVAIRRGTHFGGAKQSRRIPKRN